MAIATVISRAVELLICILFSHRVKNVRISLFNIVLRKAVLSRDFVVYSLPAVGNEFVWGAAFATYSAILGRLGEDIVAANSIVNVVRNLASILCFGMAYGGAILLGKQIGEGDFAKVKRNGTRLVRSTIAAGVIASVCMLAMRPLMPRLADLSEAASHYRDYLLFINSYSLLGATINTAARAEMPNSALCLIQSRCGACQFLLDCYPRLSSSCRRLPFILFCIWTNLKKCRLSSFIISRGDGSKTLLGNFFQKKCDCQNICGTSGADVFGNARAV